MDFEEMKEKIENGIGNIGVQNPRTINGMTMCAKRFQNSNLEINLMMYDPSKNENPDGREEFVAIWVGNQTSDRKVKDWHTDSVKKMGIVFTRKNASLITNHITLSRDCIKKGYETISEAFSTRGKKDIEDVTSSIMAKRCFPFWEMNEILITNQLKNFEPAFLDLYKFAIEGEKEPMQNREADAIIYGQIARKRTLLDMLKGLSTPGIVTSKEQLSEQKI